MASAKGLLLSGILLALSASAGQAQSDASPVKIGVLTDMSGPYADITGAGSVEAARLAVEDIGGTVAGRPVQVLVGDHLDKPDVGANIARKWYDIDKVDVIVDMPVSSVALAVQNIARERNKAVLFSGAGTDRLTNEDCARYSAQWAYDTTTLARGTAQAVVAAGGKSWFFLTADYAFGHSLEDAAAKVVKASGGEVVGDVRHPMNAPDLSSFLLQAQASKAQVVGLADVGPDLRGAVKGAKEFGLLAGGQRLAALLMFDSDVISLGLEATQGLNLTTAYYWDLNDDTRAFAKRFMAERHAMPNMIQAGVYSAVLHYLKAIQATHSTAPDQVFAWMRANPVHDAFTANGHLRNDGAMVHDMFLMQVKTPAESHDKADILKLVRRVDGSDAYAPLSESRCKNVSH
jgi:branched-chain amino acid transport system substrate-binding protein